MKVIIVGASLIALGGCNTLPQIDDNYGLLIGSKNGVEETGTFTQWNKAYAVTANHVPGVDGDFTCTTGCDLKFIRKNQKSDSFEWRNPNPGEVVTLKGFNARRQPVNFHGVDLNTDVTDKQGSEYAYQSALVKNVKGMSGGPVYGEDGKIIGIIIGSGTMNVDGEIKRVSMYIPHQTISEQWLLFKKSLDKNISFNM